jgi:DNA-binding beta-propeller fold protein YncE
MLFPAALGVALACNDSTDPGNPPTFTITPTAQWSGGDVEVSSQSLTGTGGLPQFTIAGSPLAAVRLDDSTVSVTLPVLASGTVTLTRAGLHPESVGVVQVAGLHYAREVPGTLGFEPLVPEGVSPLVFLAEGAGATSPTLSVLDPVTDHVTTISGIGPVLTGFGVMPGFQTNRFVLRDSLNRLGTWELFPVPVLHQLSPYQVASARHQTQPSDTVWLTTFSNRWEVTRPSGTSVSDLNAISDPFRMAFSALRDRLALAVDFVPGGRRLPVFDASTGDTAYTLGLPSAHGVAFSAGADRLYLGVHYSGSVPDSLVAVTAGTGQRLAGVALPAGFTGWTMAVDPSADRLYQVADSSGTPTLFVYDGTTLARQGRLGCPSPCGNSNFWSAGLGIDAATGRIHVAYPGTPIPIITYDRLP